MPQLEAEWDPTTGKIVYRDVAAIKTTTAETPSTTIENDNPNSNDEQQNALPILSTVSSRSPTKIRRRSRSNKSEKVQFDWRMEDSKILPTLNNSSNHRAISPSRFHYSNTKDIVPSYHLETTIKIRLRELAYKRRAFKEITTYRSFPLQDHAIHFCQQLLKEWGQQEREQQLGTDKETHIDDVHFDENTYSSSSGTSSLDIPEPKRIIRALHMSPTESTMLEQFRNTFINQRTTLPKSVPATQALGSALYCLEPRIFAIESKKSCKVNNSPTKSTATDTQSGRRRYVAAHIGRFMDVYWSKTEPDWRHAYELIPPFRPCRLYLDIECTDHPDLIGCSSTVIALQEALLNELFDELAIEIHDTFGNEILHCSNTNRSYKILPLQRQDIVDLDSSTETKFSRHWIVHIPVVEETTTITDAPKSEALFPDNISVGVFVRQWVGRMAEHQATGQLKQQNRNTLTKYLFLPKKAKATSATTSAAIDKASCLIDMGVYTRNRLFRLMGSMKFGKPVTAAFRIAETNQFPFSNNFGNHCFYAPAMKHNEEQPSSPSMLLDVGQSSDASAIKKSLSKTDWSSHADALAQTFVVPINVEKIDYPILSRLESADASDLENRVIKLGPLRSTGHTLTTCYGKSPYPMVDEFVQEHLANRGGKVGTIRAWSIDVNSTTSKHMVISYQMCHNRWCECVGREHKSNNIIWNCNLLSMECYQTCHDPDCRALNFRGRPVPLPQSVQDELQDTLFEEDLARLDITELGQAQETSIESQNNYTGHIDDDDDSSFDNALAAINLQVPTSSPTLINDVNTTSSTPPRIGCTAIEISKIPLSQSNDVSFTKVNEQYIQKKYSTDNLHGLDSDDDSDEEDLVELARKIEQKRKEQE